MILYLLNYLHWDSLHSNRGHTECVIYTTVDVLAKYTGNYMYLAYISNPYVTDDPASVSNCFMLKENVGMLKLLWTNQ